MKIAIEASLWLLIKNKMKNFFNRYRNGDRALGSRLSTMTMAISLLDSCKKNNFVETGTTRKNIFTHPKVEDRAADGSSTLFFADYANRYGGRVWTCDIEHQNIENCKIATKEYENLITYVVDDSVHFLENLNEPIDFLYLDSLDSESPLAHHHQLKEIKAAYSKLHQNTVILLDDLGSKTDLSIEFLKNNNWCQIKIDIPRPSHYNNFMQGLFVKEEFLYVNHSLIPHHLRFKDL
jgi:hypothetical protein